MAAARKKVEPSTIPHSDEAERVVLGALMRKPESRVLIADWIDHHAFYSKQHALIFETIITLADQGKPCDAVMVADYLQGMDCDELVGGWNYIIQIGAQSIGAATIQAYAEIIAEKAKLRAAIDIADRMRAAAMERNAESSSVLGIAQAQLAEYQAVDRRGGLQSPALALNKLWEQMSRVFESGSRMVGMPTQWQEINKATHGLENGDLIIVAARPNMGKTIFGLNLAQFTALRHLSYREEIGEGQVLFFSLEMTSAKLMGRSVSSLSGVPHDWIKAPGECEDSKRYWDMVAQWMNTLRKTELNIDDSPALNVAQIVARARRANLRKKVRLVVVDHAQIVATPGKGNRNDEVGVITRTLKALAKELDCPVVLLSQLNRSLEMRADKHPTMADLRDSGNIEQDADVVLFLYRDDYYDAESYLRGVVEVIVGKGRDMETGGTFYLRNEFDRMRMVDWEGPLPQRPVKQKEPKEKKSGGFKEAKAKAAGGTSERKDIDG